MITAERKAQLDALIQQQRGGQTSSGISPERKAQLDALIASQRGSDTQMTQSTQQPTQAQPGAFQSFVQGVAKPFEKVVATIAGIGEGAYNLLRGDTKAANEALSRERDFGYFGKARPLNIGENGKQLSPVENLKNVAGTAAELGSYIVPVEGIAAKGAGLLGRAGEGLALGAASGALGGAGQALQQEGSTAGDVLKGGLLGGVTGGVVGGALPVAGAALKGITGIGGRVGGEILGKTTGGGEAGIREFFDNPSAIKYARQAGKEGPEGLMTQALEEAQKGLSALKESRGSAYRSQLEKIQLDKRSLDGITNSVRERANALLGEHDIAIDKLTSGKGLNTLNFENSSIEGGQSSVQKAYNTVMGWTDNTPAGLDTLKKKLDKFYNAIPRDGAGDAKRFVLELKNGVSDALKTNVPGYREMTAGYGEASDLIDEIQSALSLKDTASKDTAIRKLMSTMRQNNELRRELLQTLGSAAGKDITGKIAGATFAAKTPRGLAGALSPTAAGFGGAMSIIHPSSIPFILLYLASSSPRIAAEFVNILSKFKGREIPAVYQQQLRNLILKSMSESDQATPSIQEGSGGATSK